MMEKSVDNIPKEKQVVKLHGLLFKGRERWVSIKISILLEQGQPDWED